MDEEMDDADAATASESDQGGGFFGDASDGFSEDTTFDDFDSGGAEEGGSSVISTLWDIFMGRDE